MRWIIALLRDVATLWIEGFARAPSRPSVDGDTDHDTRERERERLALAPWWV
jgi:hypothetical protein